MEKSFLILTIEKMNLKDLLFRCYNCISRTQIADEQNFKSAKDELNKKKKMKLLVLILKQIERKKILEKISLMIFLILKIKSKKRKLTLKELEKD